MTCGYFSVSAMRSWVRTASAELTRQHDLSLALHDAIVEARGFAAAAEAKGQTELARALAAVPARHQSVIDALQDADAPLTDAMVQAATERLEAWQALRARWLAVR